MIADILTSFTYVIRAAICWWSAFFIFTQAGSGELRQMELVPYLLGTLLCLLFFRRLLSTPRPLPLIAGLGSAWTAGMSGILIPFFSTLCTFWQIFFGIVAVGTVVFLSIQTILEPLPNWKLQGSLEITTLFFLFFLLYQSMSGMSYAYSLPLLCAVVLSLLAAALRQLTPDDPSGAGLSRPLLLLSAAAAVFLLTAALFLIFGAEAVSRGALVLFTGSIHFLRLCGAALGRLMNWLLSLTGTAEDLPPEAVELSPSPSVNPEAVIEYDPTFILVLGGCLAAALLIALLVVLYRLRNTRLGVSGAAVSGTAVQRSRISLMDWLHRLATEIRRRIRLTAAVLSARNTPEGIYWYLLRRDRWIGCRRKAGESPAAYLRRAADEGDAASLRLAAEVLEQNLYSPSPASLPADTCRRIRWRARGRMGQNLLRHLGSRIRRFLPAPQR